MAKRMEFSVVGLPHYTVWHLYEPSVDDIRHMEEMEQERLNRENEERERADRMKKIKEEFNDPNSQWEKDKSDIEGLSKTDEEAQKRLEGASVGQGNEQGPIVQPGKETAEEIAAKKLIDVKDSPETKGAKDVKDPKDVKDAKDFKDTKEVKDKKESKDAKDGQEIKEVKKKKDTKDPQSVQEVKMVEDAKDVKDTKDGKDGKDAKVVWSKTCKIPYLLCASQAIASLQL